MSLHSRGRLKTRSRKDTEKSKSWLWESPLFMEALATCQEPSWTGHKLWNHNSNWGGEAFSCPSYGFMWQVQNLTFPNMSKHFILLIKIQDKAAPCLLGLSSHNNIAQKQDRDLEAWGMTWPWVLFPHNLPYTLEGPLHGGSSWTRERTLVPCIVRWILNHWTTREAPALGFLTWAMIINIQAARVSQ